MSRFGPRLGFLGVVGSCEKPEQIMTERQSGGLYKISSIQYH